MGNPIPSPTSSLEKGTQTLLTRPSVLNAEDDHFNAAAMDAKWTPYGSPVADLSTLPGWVKQAGADFDYGWTQPAPAKPFTIEGEFLQREQLSPNWGGAGLLLTNGQDRTTASGSWLHVTPRANDILRHRVALGAVDPGGGVPALYSSHDLPIPAIPLSHFWLRMKVHASGGIDCYLSVDGRVFHKLFDTAIDSFSGPPTAYIGIYLNQGAACNYFVRR